MEDKHNLLINRARTIAAMGMVERDYEGFNVTSPGIKKETFRVWRDEEGRVRCSCADYEARITAEPRYRCEHILAVKFHLEPPEPAKEDLFPNKEVGIAEIRQEMDLLRNLFSSLQKQTEKIEGMIENFVRLHEPGEKNIFPKDPVAKTMADMITPKQLVAIRAIANAHDINPETECLTILKCRPEELSRKAASIFIDYLKSKAKVAES